MRLIRRRGADLKKLTRLAIAVNLVQICCALAILLRALFVERFDIPDEAELALLAFACGVIIWGAAVDIRDAFIMRREDAQRDMLEEAYVQLEELNQTLREQRHDFKNHLQVVYSLTEMGAYSDVQEYVERIYEDVQSVSRQLRTAVPAVNALLAAKEADCREQGVAFEAAIQSAWEDMPVSGWELCRIIGNLVDNAIDALREKPTKVGRIQVCISENIPCFLLSVENNGPAIPPEAQERIFEPGFTTKSEGHGSGLSIVRALVEDYGGQIRLESDPERTRFSLSFPRAGQPNPSEGANG